MRHFDETDANNSEHELPPRHKIDSFANRKCYASITEMNQYVVCEVRDTAL
jgi:hypothetical protein